ncbi:MAG TPA: hypothetical protein VGG62_17815 [Terracidiphilus sp.]|jgi:predicted ATP-grasp superfamily ATP-dependent carboligase
MMTHTELQGTHEPSNGEGLTIQDLLDLLKRVPAQARGNYLRVNCGDGEVREVTGLQFAQSDQAEKWEFKVYLKAI